MAYQRRIVTSHGTLAVEERGEGKTSVLLIHGNSSCRNVFHYQLEAPFAASYRVIAFDLPGHMANQAMLLIRNGVIRCLALLMRR